ncbi:MAG: TIGR03663 family protein [Deltaproteobacteria bacterium]|nr:TIGR03663 family protein [Deltaproteobacteria bacterium]
MPESRLDRRALITCWVGVLLLVAFSFWLRLPGLEDKPLHSDEGVNGWFTLRLWWWNYYVYRHSDYHGPFLYYWNLLWFQLMGGPSDAALRMGTVVTGSLLPAALLPARRQLGTVGVLMTGLLLTVAPCVVYFSRTNIHEIHLLFFTILWGTTLLRFAAEPSMKWGLLSAAASALAFANKETALITLGALGLGGGIAWLLGRAGDADDPHDPDVFGGRDRRSALFAWTKESWVIWAAGAGVFAVIIILFFSSFFTYWSGVGGFFQAYGPWTEYGVTGRNQGKPFGYFFELMKLTEGWALYMTAPAMVWALVRRHRFGLALIGWFLGSFVVYSAISYKTPWCVLNIDLAGFVLVGWSAQQAWLAARNANTHVGLRGLGALLMLVPLSAVPGLLATSLDDNADRYDDKKVPYVYVQTEREFFPLLQDALGAARARPADDGKGLNTLSVWAKNPYRWYVITRGWDHDRARYAKKVPKQKWIDKADLVLATGKDLRETQKLMEAQTDAWHTETYKLRPGHRIHAYFRQELWDDYQAAGGRAATPWPQPSVDDIPVPRTPKGAPK